MPREPYRVEYHVCCVIYLEPTRELSGPDFARLWSGTRIFGKQKVTGAFWHEGTPPKSDGRAEIGSLEPIRRLLDLGDRPIFGGGVHVKSRSVARNVIQDRDFYYAHTSQMRKYGCDTTPQLLYAVSGQWFEATGPDVVLEHMREHFEVADRHGAFYGLIDVAASEDCCGGVVYEPMGCSLTPLHRYIEDFKWCLACSTRRDQARGVYWGNYFGTEILKRLGGRQHFSAWFRDLARFPDGRPCARVWEFAKGVFVSLCLDPLMCKPGELNDIGLAMQWLVTELGSRGVLDPWAGKPTTG